MDFTFYATDLSHLIIGLPKKKPHPNRILISYSNAEHIGLCYIIEQAFYIPIGLNLFDITLIVLYYLQLHLFSFTRFHFVFFFYFLFGRKKK